MGVGSYYFSKHVISNSPHLIRNSAEFRGHENRFRIKFRLPWGTKESPFNIRPPTFELFVYIIKSVCTAHFLIFSAIFCPPCNAM
jgi:hypothetical protein